MPGIFLSQKSPAMQKKIGEVTLLQSIFFEGHFCHETSFQKKKAFLFLGRNYPGGFQACGVCLRQGPAPR